MCVIYAYVLVCVKHNLVRRELSDLASNKINHADSYRCTPAYYKVDRVWLCLDSCLGEAQLVCWPEFISEEAACVDHLVT